MRGALGLQYQVVIACFGYAAPEAIGKSMLRIVLSELASEEKEILARIARGEKTEHFETPRLQRKGSPISPLGDHCGAVRESSERELRIACPVRWSPRPRRPPQSSGRPR